MDALFHLILDDIVDRVYLITGTDDVEGNRRSVRMVLRTTLEQLERGVGERECRALFMEAMWDDGRRLGVDPESLLGETAMAVGTRMIDACLDAVRHIAL